MLTPRHVMFGARGGLVAGFWASALVLMGPWQGVGRPVGVSDWLAHVIAFGLLVALASLAFPNRRRNDIAIALLLLAGGVEAVRIFTGQAGASLADWASDALGVAIIHFAGQIETVRSLARRAPYQTFQEIRSSDRRRGRRKSKRSKASIGSAGAGDLNASTRA